MNATSGTVRWKLPARTILAAVALVLGAVPYAGCSSRTEFSGEKAMAHLVKQVSFGPRVPGTPEHDACRDWLVSQLKQTCDTVEVQSFKYRRVVNPRRYRDFFGLAPGTRIPTSSTFPMDNIVAVINGSDGKPPHYLLCAHWDSRPTADLERSEERKFRAIPGANDGASGVAVLLELARVFKEKRPTQGVILALFDGEDLGPEVDDMLLGARHYAKNPIPVKPKQGILLDMVGDTNLKIQKERLSVEAAGAFYDTIFQTAARLGYSKQFVPETIYPIQDDHVPLNEAGIPTVNLIDFEYPYWHTLQDTPDKCSPASLEAVGRTVAAVVYGK